MKQSTQNDFVYGELGRIDCQSRRYLAIIKYWFKVVSCDENRHIKQVYNMMLNITTLKTKLGFMRKRFVKPVRMFGSMGIIRCR